MHNKEFKNVIDAVLTPLGFRRKGNYWRLVQGNIEKVVYLQKSSFSNTYYLNYGYNLLNLNDESMIIHIFNRIGSADQIRKKLIDETFNLESDIKPEIRKGNLISILHDQLLMVLNDINSENDIKEFLNKENQLNDIPLAAKKHLDLGTS